MMRVEEAHPVEHYRSSSACPASHIRNRGPVRGSRRGRRHRDRSQSVGLQDCWQHPHHGRIHNEGVPRDRDGVSRLPSCVDDEGIQRHRGWPQQHQHLSTGKLIVVPTPGLIAISLDLDADHRPRWRARGDECPKPVRLSGCDRAIPVGKRDSNAREGHGLQIDAVAHHSRESGLLQSNDQETRDAHHSKAGSGLVMNGAPASTHFRISSTPTQRRLSRANFWPLKMSHFAG